MIVLYVLLIFVGVVCFVQAFREGVESRARRKIMSKELLKRKLTSLRSQRNTNAPPGWTEPTEVRAVNEVHWRD